MTDDERRAQLTEAILTDVRGLWKHHDELHLLTEREANSIVKGAMLHFQESQTPGGRPFSIENLMNLVTALLTLTRETTLRHVAERNPPTRTDDE